MPVSSPAKVRFLVLNKIRIRVPQLEKESNFGFKTSRDSEYANFVKERRLGDGSFTFYQFHAILFIIS